MSLGHIYFSKLYFKYDVYKEGKNNNINDSNNNTDMNNSNNNR